MRPDELVGSEDIQLSDNLLPIQGQPVTRGTLGGGRLALEVTNLAEGCTGQATKCCGGCSCFLGDDE